ncbi:MAG: hypothetical protein AB7G75_00340 [Candidatus Binatia bacterium]
MRMNKTAVFVLVGLYGVVFFPSLAEAYLDPGNGSMLLQLLLGGFAGLSVLLKLYWHQLLTTLGLAKKEEKTVADSQSQMETPAAPQTNQL